MSHSLASTRSDATHCFFTHQSSIGLGRAEVGVAVSVLYGGHDGDDGLGLDVLVRTSPDGHLFLVAHSMLAEQGLCYEAYARVSK